MIYNIIKIFLFINKLNLIYFFNQRGGNLYLQLYN